MASQFAIIAALLYHFWATPRSKASDVHIWPRRRVDRNHRIMAHHCGVAAGRGVQRSSVDPFNPQTALERRRSSDRQDRHLQYGARWLIACFGYLARARACRMASYGRLS